MVVLDLPTPSLKNRCSAQQQIDNALENEWTAHGQLIITTAEEDDLKHAAVIIRSVSAEHIDDTEKHADWTPFAGMRPSTAIPHSDSSITVSLTRTRWCTKIRSGLLDSIKLRRSD